MMKLSNILKGAKRGQTIAIPVGMYRMTTEDGKMIADLGLTLMGTSPNVSSLQHRPMETTIRR